MRHKARGSVATNVWPASICRWLGLKPAQVRMRLAMAPEGQVAPTQQGK